MNNKYFVIILMFIITMVASDNRTVMIKKCCAKGKQLYRHEIGDVVCIDLPNAAGSDEEIETLQYPINRTVYSWLPPTPNHTIVIQYGTLSNVMLDVSLFFVCNNSSENVEFHGKVHSSFIEEERFCYDSTPTIGRVLLKSYRLKPIAKCCPKGEKLSDVADKCVPHSGTSESITQEVARLSEFQNWLPLPLQFANNSGNVSQYVVKVKYNAFQFGFAFSASTPESAGLSWRVVDSGGGGGTAISFGSRDSSAATETFCFDEVSAGPLAPRVLLSAPHHAPKCCGEGEHLSGVASACVPRPEERLGKGERGFVHLLHSIYDVYWLPYRLPKIFHHDHTPVRYNEIFRMSRFSSDLKIITDESIWRLQPGNDTSLPKLILKSRTSGKTVETRRYCFDHFEGTGRVVVVHIPKVKPTSSTRNCSFPEYTCSSEKLCVDDVDSPPRHLPKPAFYEPFVKSDILLSLQSGCKNITDVTLSSAMPAGESGEPRPEAPCGGCEGAIAEVVASCGSTEPPRVAVALAAAVAAAAGAAAVIVLARVEMRRSAHGRAIACHACCLSAASALSVMAYFQQPTATSGCVPYMYITYFFMVSANWWLTAITWNILKNFRQPLGALASCGGAVGSAATGRRFTIMSMMAWGGATAITLFNIIMHQNKERLHALGVITPSFLETRTCTYQFEFATDIRSGAFLHASKWGTFFYHCVPMGLLAGADGVFVGLTIHTLHSLRRGTALVHKGRVPLHMRSALLYAKLLMTTGVVEMILQALTWASLDEGMRYFGLHGAILVSMEHVYGFAGVANIIDLIRAASVLWMSTGRLWRVRKGWGTVRGWLGMKPSRRFHRGALSRTYTAEYSISSFQDSKRSVLSRFSSKM